MQFYFNCWLTFFATLGLAAAARSQDNSRQPPSRQIGAIDETAIDRVVAMQMQEQKIVGVALGVVLEGKTALTKGYGYADLERETPVTTDTVFNWASNSKPVMAVAAMQLVQQRTLDLDADVRRYVPEFPEKPTVIKVRHLLSHQSGIPHYSNGRVLSTAPEVRTDKASLDPLTAIRVFDKSPLLFEPGERYSYSSYGYILLSAVVQRAGKASIEEQLQQRIIKPLQLSSFQLDLPSEGQPNWALAYSADAAGKQTRVPDQAHFWKHGAGGYKSNVVDFAKWAGGLLNSQLVDQDCERQMWTPQATRAGNPTNYGFGFNTERHGDLHQVSHGGSQEETKTHMVLLPQTKSGIVVMCNSARGRPALIAAAIMKILSASQSP